MWKGGCAWTLLPEVLSTVWGLDRLWVPIVHDGLEMRNNYLSMSTRTVQNEQRTTRSCLWRSQGWARMPLGNGKASVLDQQARRAKYITTQEDEAPSLSVEDRTKRDSDGCGFKVIKDLGCFVSTCIEVKLECAY